jgi:DNA-binding MarR family transcriptional regulator
MHRADERASGGWADELNDELIRFVRLVKTAAHNDVGLDRSLLHLLWPLMHEGPMRLRDLAEAKGSDASTVSRQAAQLVRSGLIRRDPDPYDRRACLVTLTDGGRDMCQRMIDARREAIADALKAWSPERVRAFTEMFREFNQAIEAVKPGHRDGGSPAGIAPAAPTVTQAWTEPPTGADDTAALVAAP